MGLFENIVVSSKNSTMKHMFTIDSYHDQELPKKNTGTSKTNLTQKGTKVKDMKQSVSGASLVSN